jgi:feruloyl esterase
MPLRMNVALRSLARLSLLVSLTVLPACLTAPEEAALGTQSDELVRVDGFGSNPGRLRMYEYAPRLAAAGAPLVVALHGCTQDAAAYTQVGFNAFADRYGFRVIYPEQSPDNNRNRCFNWFEPQDISRGQGEALSIKQMVDWMIANRGVDPRRVYITGLSAGGAMTSVMLATYPETFAAGAIMAGLPHGCAATMLDAFSCMNPGKPASGDVWANRVRAASDHVGPWPRVAIWHGTRDTTVAPANADASRAQWSTLHGASAVSLTERVGKATHTVYALNGEAKVETWMVDGMGHGTSIAPGAGCGTAGAYVLDTGVCSTKLSLDFFGLSELSPLADAGTTPPRDATPPPASDAGAVPDAAPAATCVEHGSPIVTHVERGRAYRCGVGGSYACATGSNERIGLYTMMQATLREVSAGYFELGRCATR